MFFSKTLLNLFITTFLCFTGISCKVNRNPDLSLSGDKLAPTKAVGNTNNADLKFYDIYGSGFNTNFLQEIEYQALKTGKIGICIALMGIPSGSIESETTTIKRVVTSAFNNWMEQLSDNPRWPFDKKIGIEFEIRTDSFCEGFQQPLPFDGTSKIRIAYYIDMDKFQKEQCHKVSLYSYQCVSFTKPYMGSISLGPNNGLTNKRAFDQFLNVINPASWFDSNYRYSYLTKTTLHEFGHIFGLGDQYFNFGVSMPSAAMKTSSSLTHDDKVGIWFSYHNTKINVKGCEGFGTVISGASYPLLSNSSAICQAEPDIEKIKTYLLNFNYGRANEIPDEKDWKNLENNAKIKDDWGWCWRYWEGYNYVYSSKSGCSSAEAVLQTATLPNGEGELLRFKNNPTKCFAINKANLEKNALELVDCSSNNTQYFKLFEINKSDSKIFFTSGGTKHCLTEGSGTQWSYIYAKDFANCNTRNEILKFN